MNQKRERSLKTWVKDSFFPNMIVPSPDLIDYRQLATSGYRIVLLDIDNTLTRHGTHQGDDFAQRVIREVQKADLLPIIASNAREERARSFASSLGVAYISKARKPDARVICQALESHDCKPGQAIMVGDQLLTDVLSARRGGIPVILTDRRSRKEIITVRAKRILEWILIRLGGKEDFDRLRQVSIDQLTGGAGRDCL